MSLIWVCVTCVLCMAIVPSGGGQCLDWFIAAAWSPSLGDYINSIIYVYYLS